MGAGGTICRNSILFSAVFKWESGSSEVAVIKKTSNDTCPKTVKTNKLHRQKHLNRELIQPQIFQTTL